MCVVYYCIHKSFSDLTIIAIITTSYLTIIAIIALKKTLLKLLLCFLWLFMLCTSWKEMAKNCKRYCLKCC